MINQNGGFYVKTDKRMFNYLTHLSGEISNTACGVIGLNMLGVDKDIIESAIKLVGKETARGLYRDKILEFYQEYINRIKEGKTSDRNIKLISDTLIDPLDEISETILDKSENVPNDFPYILSTEQITYFYNWLKRRIPKGTATLFFVPGHVSIVGKTFNEEDIFVIDAQLGGEGGKETFKPINRQFTATTMSESRPVTGIHRGQENLGKYLNYFFSSAVLDKYRYIAIPHRRILLDYRPPQVPTEQIFPPFFLGRQPSVQFTVDEALANIGLKSGIIKVARDIGKKNAFEILKLVKQLENHSGKSFFSDEFIPEIFDIIHDYKPIAYELIGAAIDEGSRTPSSINNNIINEFKKALGESGPEIIKKAIEEGRVNKIEDLLLLTEEQTGSSRQLYLKELFKSRTNVKPGKFALKI